MKQQSEDTSKESIIQGDWFKETGYYVQFFAAYFAIQGTHLRKKIFKGFYVLK